MSLFRLQQATPYHSIIRYNTVYLFVINISSSTSDTRSLSKAKYGFYCLFVCLFVINISSSTSDTRPLNKVQYGLFVCMFVCLICIQLSRRHHTTPQTTIQSEGRLGRGWPRYGLFIYLFVCLLFIDISSLASITIPFDKLRNCFFVCS